MLLIRLLSLILLFATSAISAPMADYSFKSPSFNGAGYSSHVLTIENQESTRKAQLQKVMILIKVKP